MKYNTSYETNTGTTKKINQDSLLLKVADTTMGQVVFAAICDGIGGLNKGELASKEVIAAFDIWFLQDLPILLKEGFEAETLKMQWTQTLQRINKALISYGEEQGCHIGTTLTAILCIGEKYYIFHVGDTRVYAVNEQIIRLTKDHTLVQKKVEAGTVTEEEAKSDPERNVLLQAVGISKNIMPDFIAGDVEHNTTYLLCSDGFCNQLTEQEILEQIKQTDMHKENNITETLKHMQQMVMDRGEKDNITAIAIYSI